MLQAALGVGTTILLARTLGPSGFGAVAVALAIVFTVAGLSDLGFSVAFVRLGSPMVMSGGDIRHLHTTFLFMRAVVAIALAVVVTASGSWLLPSLRMPAGMPWLAAAAALAGVTMAAGNHYVSVLQVLRGQRTLALSRSGLAALRLTAYATLAGLGLLSLRAAVAVALLAVPAEALVVSWFAHRNSALFPPVFRMPPRAWLTFSVWMAVPAVTYALVGQSDTLLLSGLTGPAETGIWNAAARVSGVLLLASGAAWSVALPYASAIIEQQQLMRYLRLVRNGAIALAAGTAVAVVLSPWAVGLLYGARYAGAGSVLRVLFAANALGSVNILLLPVALRLGHERLVAVVGVVEFSVNLAGDLLLIPPYGALGSAIATLAMHVAGAIVLGAVIAHDLRRRGADPLPAHIG